MCHKGEEKSNVDFACWAKPQEPHIAWVSPIYVYDLLGSDTVGNHNPCTRVIVSLNILHGCTYCGRSPSNLTFFCPACTNVQFAKFKTAQKLHQYGRKTPTRQENCVRKKGVLHKGGSVNNWAADKQRNALPLAMAPAVK